MFYKLCLACLFKLRKVWCACAAILTQYPANICKCYFYNAVEQYVAGRDYKRAEYRARGPEAGVFCYMLSSATIGIPQGAQLFVSGEAKPTNGGLVLAVTTSGEIILATYTATGNTFTLTGSQNITGQLSKAQELFTMLAPVIEYTVFIR